MLAELVLGLGSLWAFIWIVETIEKGPRLLAVRLAVLGLTLDIAGLACIFLPTDAERASRREHGHSRHAQVWAAVLLFSGMMLLAVTAERFWTYPETWNAQ